MIVLAALILGALVAIGIPSKVETGVSSAICRIFQGENCGKPEATGQNPGGQKPGDQQTGGQNNGGQNNGHQNAGGQNPNGGDQPSLADLQKKADDAQKAANSTEGKYGNIKQEIIDLLKDFIGITDIEDCISKGSISSCLWAAFDVASWVFAALKIAKFAKAVKDAIKLWKEFNKGRKLIDKAKDAAKRAREALKKKRRQLGCPTAYRFPNAPPGRVIHAAYADLSARPGGVRVVTVAIPAKPKDPAEPDCGNEVTSVIGKDNFLKRAAEAAGKDEKVQKDLNHLRDELMKGNVNAGLENKALTSTVRYMRARSGARLFYRKTAQGYELVGKSSKANEDKVIKYLKKNYP